MVQLTAFNDRITRVRPVVIKVRLAMIGPTGRLQHWCFPVNFAKFLKAPILKNICERLSLTSASCIFMFQILSHFQPSFGIPVMPL